MRRAHLDLDRNRGRGAVLAIAARTGRSAAAGTGVHAANGKVYIADSYNHKIKVADPATRAVKTVLGDGKRGKEDGAKPRFHEPSGLWAVGDKLFVADQNNHAIRVCDLAGGSVTTVPVEKK